MAPYDQNFCNRFRVRYTSFGLGHGQTIHYGTDPADVATPPVTQWQAVQDAVAALLWDDWTATSAAVAAAGSDTFLPRATPGITNGANAKGDRAGYGPVYLSFQGLSSAGVRASLTFFGSAVSPIQAAADRATDYRITEGEDGDIDATLAALDAASQFTAIDGNSIFWHRYANVGVNAYWEHAVRPAV